MPPEVRVGRPSAPDLVAIGQAVVPLTSCTSSGSQPPAPRYSQAVQKLSPSTHAWPGRGTIGRDPLQLHRTATPKSTAPPKAKQKADAWSRRPSAGSGALPAASVARRPSAGAHRREAACEVEALEILGRDGAPLSIHHYHRGVATPPQGLVVLAPGSRGGMGPGQTPATIGKFYPATRSVYTALARQLAARRVAVCHLTWRSNPTRPGAPRGTLKAPQTLLDGATDIARPPVEAWRWTPGGPGLLLAPRRPDSLASPHSRQEVAPLRSQCLIVGTRQRLDLRTVSSAPELTPPLLGRRRPLLAMALFNRPTPPATCAARTRGDRPCRWCWWASATVLRP